MLRCSSWVGASLFALVAVGACSGDDGNAGDEPPSQTNTYGTSACGTCLGSWCQPEIDACSADPGCAAYYQCLLACPPDALGNPEAGCEAACPASDNSTTEQLKGQLTLCRLDEAAPACACTSGVFEEQPCSPSTETNACWKCEDERCCTTQQGCRDDAGCAALVDCLQACPVGDIACSNGCTMQYDAAMALFGPRLACTMAKCSNECGGDPCSTCVMDNCAESYTACISRADCWSLSACVGECGGLDTCIDACVAQYPSATDLFWVTSYCMLSICEQACL